MDGFPNPYTHSTVRSWNHWNVKDPDTYMDRIVPQTRNTMWWIFIVSLILHQHFALQISKKWTEINTARDPEKNVKKLLSSILVFHGISKNSGTPKSSILIGSSTINHPFSGTPIFGNIHMSRIMMNVGNPETAFAFGQLPNEGIGLARLEFVAWCGIEKGPLDGAKMSIHQLKIQMFFS